MLEVKKRTNELLNNTGDITAVEEIIKLNKGLVGKQLKKFGLVGDPEAISFGYEALYNAIMTFSTSKNNEFSTYATICIYNRLGSHVRSLNTSIRKNTISYDEPIDEKGTTHLEYMESCFTADGDVLDEEGCRLILLCVTRCLEEFTNETQRGILEVWCDSNFEMTNKDISDRLGCSQSYVNQTIGKFRKSLKSKLEAMK